MGKTTSEGPEKGKGGNFDTRTNPFLKAMKYAGGYPELTDEPRVTKAIDAALAKGCAVMIGTTRDGGAIVITILDGDDRHRTYCANSDELTAAADAMIELYSQ